MNKRNSLTRELADHLARRAAELHASGLSLAQARRQAAAEFGSLDAIAEEVRDARPLRWLRDAFQDLRFALRSWRRAPAFACSALAILALGLAANAIVFGVVQATLLRPLSFPHSTQLVYLSEYDNHGADQTFSDPDLADYQAQMSPVFSAMGGYRDINLPLTLDPTHAELQPGRLVTRGMLSTLAVPPLLGRWFSPAEHQPNGPKAVLLGYTFWQSHFAGRRDILGRQLTISNALATIVGVMPPGFQFGPLSQIYLPYEQWVPPPYHNDRANSFILYGIGRMRPGRTQAQVDAQTALVSARLARQYPASNATVHASAEPMAAHLRGPVSASLWMVYASTAMLLLIVCLNLANLLLARAAGRDREMAVRAALGAGRSRLARQLLAEGLLLSLSGAALALTLANWGLRATSAALPTDFPLAGSLTLNPALALYLVAAALATGLVFSLAPILLAARVSFRARSGSGRHRLHATLIVAEVGLAMALLTASGLMLHSIVKLNRVDLGFNPDHLLTATVSTSRAEAAQPGGVTRFFATLRQRAASLPGVQSVGVVFPVPYTTQIANCFVAMPGHAPDPNAPLTTYYFNVSADYFRTMQQALLKGRTFTPADDQPGAPPVAIVDASLAREYYGSVDKALGSQIQMFTQTFTPAPKTGRPPATIVGIVASIKAEGPDVTSHRELYVPLSQPNGGMTLVLRTASSDSAAPLTPAVRNIVHQMDPGLVPPRIATMDALVARAERLRLAAERLLAAFALAALLLAALGLYAVLAFLVQQRRRELGVRLALGASRAALQSLVVTQGMRLAIIGLVLGAGATLALARLMSNLLFQVTPFDPTTLAAASAVLLAAALAAAYLPARRAARTDPMQALRAD